MKTAVIIPVTRSNPHLFESLETLHALYANENVEVIVLPNQAETLPHCRVIPTGPLGPGDKRDIGAKATDADILAFLDDDAYPTKDWLEHSLRHFQNETICGVAGPALTPPHDPFWARVSGSFFVTPFGGGNTERYWPGEQTRDVDDWPTVNLLVRREDFLKVGGFQTAFWPGEDTKLCRDLVYELKKRIVYEPQALVFHHRREGLKRHLRQVGRYGLHRGFFTKKYPETSMRLSYFVPTLFTLAMLIGVLALPLFPWPLSSILFLYGLGCLASSLIIFRREKSARIAVASIPYTFLSHVVYGWNFFRGAVLTRDLRSTLRA